MHRVRFRRPSKRKHMKNTVIPETCPQCWRWKPPDAKEGRATHVTAVFSDEWNRSFRSENKRQTLRTDSGSEEEISRFTAIFCDNWKDEKEEEEDVNVPDFARLSKDEKESIVDGFAQPLGGSQDSSDRKCQERQYPSTDAKSLVATLSELSPFVSPSSPDVSLSVLATFPESQMSSSTISPSNDLGILAQSQESPLSFGLMSPESQLNRFGELMWEVPLSPTRDLCSSVPPSLVSCDENDLFTPGSVVSHDMFLDVPGSVQPLDLNLTEFDKLGNNLCMASLPETGENSLLAITNMTLTATPPLSIAHSHGTLPRRQCFQEDGCTMESGGFEVWDEFMKCYLGID
ncbi:hypothetical protein B0J14DRAFT_694802 [Halenospora varia]|nr:hypothetical protein B0J14DRAFT_694802 [Halenospora varia]